MAPAGLNIVKIHLPPIRQDSPAPAAGAGFVLASHPVLTAGQTNYCDG